LLEQKSIMLFAFSFFKKKIEIFFVFCYQRIGGTKSFRKEDHCSSWEF